MYGGYSIFWFYVQLLCILILECEVDSGWGICFSNLDNNLGGNKVV